MSASWIKPFFVLSALYDGILGIAFVFFWRAIFRWFGVEPPNHPAYVQFPALLLVIFAAMFLRIAKDPVGNRDLIPYGVALKVAYCGTAFWYQVTAGIPFMWIPWAWADLGFLVLFVVAWRKLGSPAPAHAR
jgi:hypothetical protein